MPGVAWLGGEDVLLLAVAMPSMPAAQRRAAVAFAVEDRIAQPLDEVHVVLGPSLGGGRWLVAVVSHTAMAAQNAIAGLRLLPDTLALPVPAQGWAVWGGARVLVRQADGSGFATSQQALPAFWAAAGSPPVTLYAGALPPGIPVAFMATLPVLDAALATFDLRAGRHAGRGAGWPRGLRGLLAVLALAGLGHLALLTADVVALGRIAKTSATALHTALAATGQSTGTDLETALAQALAARQPAGQGGLLPLMVQIFTALAADAGRVTLQDLRYAAAGNTATLTLEAPDLATLQGVETALAGAGLTVSAGAATTGGGAAEVQMTITGPTP